MVESNIDLEKWGMIEYSFYLWWGDNRDYPCQLLFAIVIEKLTFYIQVEVYDVCYSYMT